MNKALTVLFLLVTAGYCRTVSSNPPKGAALHLLGGKNAKDFDVTKPVGKGARFDLDDVDPSSSSPATTDGPATDHVDYVDYDGRPELEKRTAGGNKASDFDARKPVGRGAQSDSLPPDDFSSQFDDDDTASDGGPKDDHRPELEKRIAGGNKAPDFDATKPVGKGARSEDEDLSSSTADVHGSDLHSSDDGKPDPETQEKRTAGGNKAPDFDVTKAVGRGAQSDSLPPDDFSSKFDDDDAVTSDAGPQDDHRPELEKRSAGGWKKVI